MPHTNHWDAHGLHRQFTGVVDSDEILSSNLELHQDHRFDDIRYVINDFTLVTGLDIVEGHTRSFATVDKNVSHRKPQLKIAIVVNQPPQIMLAQAYRQHMLDSLFECEIFSNLEEAEAWARP